MAKRVQALCDTLAREYDGDAARVWTEALSELVRGMREGKGDLDLAPEEAEAVRRALAGEGAGDAGA